MMTSTLNPKQDRSKLTQQKILASLNRCLEQKYFEHISINELAEGAGVSVGTFYRRFKDKNALLPLLYDDLGNHLAVWLEQMAQNHPKPPLHNSSDEKARLINYFCQQVKAFIEQRQGMFRTLHLYARLHADILPKTQMAERQKIFEQMSHWLARQIFKQEPSGIQCEKVQMWVFIVTSTVIDKLLYGHITPATICPLDSDAYLTQLAQAFSHDIKAL